MQEKFSDPLDEAAALAAAMTESAVAAARKGSAPESHPDFDGAHCIECDDAIPQSRLTMGKIRCVHCQSDLEERKRRGLV